MEIEFKLLKESQPIEVINKIENLIENGEIEEALVEIRQIKIRVKKNLSQVYLVEASLNLLTENYLEAGDLFFKATQYSNSKEVNIKYANFLKSFTRYEEAIFYYKKALKLELSPLELAILYLDLGETFYLLNEEAPEFSSSCADYSLNDALFPTSKLSRKKFLLLNPHKRIEQARIFRSIEHNEKSIIITSKEKVGTLIFSNKDNLGKDYLFRAISQFESHPVNSNPDVQFHLIRACKSLGLIYFTDFNDSEKYIYYLEKGMKLFSNEKEFLLDRLDYLGQILFAYRCYLFSLQPYNIQNLDSLTYIDNRLNLRLEYKKEFNKLSDRIEFEIETMFSKAFGVGFTGSEEMHQNVKNAIDIELGHQAFRQAEDYYEQGENQLALESYLQTTTFYDEKISNDLFIPSLFSNLDETFNKLINLSEDYDLKISYSNKRIRHIENTLANHDFDLFVRKGLNTGIANTYGVLAWYYLLTKQFLLAESVATKALNLDSNEEWIKSFLAASKLLSNKYEEAEHIYLSLADKPYQKDINKSYREIFLLDLRRLEYNKISHPNITKAKELLMKK